MAPAVAEMRAELLGTFALPSRNVHWNTISIIVFCVQENAMYALELYVCQNEAYSSPGGEIRMWAGVEDDNEESLNSLFEVKDTPRGNETAQVAKGEPDVGIWQHHISTSFILKAPNKA